MGSWPDHLVWMRIEGDHGDWQPSLGREGHSAADDALVPSVDTVEDADSHDRRAPAAGHVVQSLPAQHLKVPPRYGICRTLCSGRRVGQPVPIQACHVTYGPG